VSTICGICRTGEAPVDPDEIDTLLDALDHWSADARGAWTAGNAGLGHLLLRTTPQSRHETMPARDAEHDLTITGDLRLDNRDELARALGIPMTGLPAWPDGRIVLRAYLQWGDRCAERLMGDFAFAIWDGRARRLFCARDRFGVKPFYYYQHDGVFAFATELKGLLALPFVDRALDETWIGDYLHQLSLDNVSTLYRRIHRLEQAHTLSLRDGRIQLRRYWTMAARRELRLASDAEYVEAFREKLVLAIRRRVESPFEVGAELSGGLDSSGISAIAQSLLVEDGRDLQTFSQVSPEGVPAELTGPDARWAIDLVCARAGITRTHFFAGDGGILPALEWAGRRCGEPPRSVASLYCHSMYDAAQASGVRVLLSGFAGNNAVSAVGHGRRRELLWGANWIELVRELAASRIPGRGKLAGALRLLASDFNGPGLDLLRRRTILWQAYPTRQLRDDVAMRLGMRRRAVRYSLRLARHGSLRAQAIRQLTRAVALRLEAENLSATSRRIEYRYPLLDSDLIELYLALPSRLKYWRGTGRYMFRQSLEPWVPADVRFASGPPAAGSPGSMLRNTRDEQELKRRLQALPSDHPLFDYVDLRKLFAPPRIRGRRPRERHLEILQALMLESALREARR
jgi:asparagine synthase (glutamine-hydrolysing)